MVKQALDGRSTSLTVAYGQHGRPASQRGEQDGNSAERP